MVNKNDFNSQDRKRKFLIIALDSAGKTSRVRCLQGIKNLPAFSSPSLTPTRGIDTLDFYALGSEYQILDFGGQEIYRNNHLENFVNQFDIF